MYLAYFNLGDVQLRAYPGIAALNIVAVVYIVLVATYMWHAWYRTYSPWRWRVAMWTDLLMVSVAVAADDKIMSPTYLAYIMVILGNGMRYGLRFFAEAVAGTFLLVVGLLALRSGDALLSVPLSNVIYIAFFGIIILYSFSLMSRIEQGRRQLEVESSLDPLTGLLNRRGLYEKTGKLFGSLHTTTKPITVLFADLDGFKGINDALGHPAGDNVLKQVSRMVVGCMRGSDIAARYGGDEFVIVLPDCDMDQAAHIAQRLQDSVASWARENEISLSVSIGMGEAPKHGEDLHSLLERVDSAMYRCKAAYGGGGIQRADSVFLN